MNDDKIISDRTLETDREEQEERRHADELPPEDRDANENTGSLLSGDALSGSGDTTDATDATDTTAPTAADNAPDTGGADVGVDRDPIGWDDGEPSDEGKRKLSEEAYFPGNNALHRY